MMADRQQADRQQDGQPKDAGLIIMLFLVVVGTLFMAWVADRSTPIEPAVVTEHEPAETLTGR